MKACLAVAVLVSLLLAAGPATKPSLAPAQPVTLAGVLKKMPREIQPQGRNEWTIEERRDAARWIGTALAGVTLQCDPERMTYEGGVKRKASIVEATDAYGTRWVVEVACTLSEKGDAVYSDNRDSKRLRFIGKVERTEGSAHMKFMRVSAVMVDVEVRKR